MTEKVVSPQFGYCDLISTIKAPSPSLCGNLVTVNVKCLHD